MVEALLGFHIFCISQIKVTGCNAARRLRLVVKGKGLLGTYEFTEVWGKSNASHGINQY